MKNTDAPMTSAPASSRPAMDSRICRGRLRFSSKNISPNAPAYTTDRKTRRTGTRSAPVTAT